MFPCLIVDRSQEGFRLKGNFRLRRGQLVELVLDDPVDSLRCEVIWTGKAGVRGIGSGVTNCRQMSFSLDSNATSLGHSREQRIVCPAGPEQIGYVISPKRRCA